MSATKPKFTRVDPSQTRPPTVRKILSEGQVVSHDADYSCIVRNDTSTAYIVYLLHDNGYLAELWGQPPGANVAIPPDWKLRINIIDNDDVLKGDTSGDEHYWFRWDTTTRANSTFSFSTMSY